MSLLTKFFLIIAIDLLLINEIIKSEEVKSGVRLTTNLFNRFDTCNTIIFKMGENDLKLNLIPRGYCRTCCPIKTNRDIRFVSYNKHRNSKNGAIISRHSVGSARKVGINSSWPTEIYIHGFTEPSPGESGQTIIDAYLSRNEDYNLILLDWSELCAFPWYNIAVENIKYVGKILKHFLEFFHDTNEIPIDNVHIVGFSLGSHIASYAGKTLREGLRIPRITALDPAFPEFSLQDTSKRLTQTDAKYIDVIHTDSGVLGFPIPIGHADFYPNGGRALQPGCQPSYLVQLRLVDKILACSHVRAWRLYAESVRNSQAFPATKCKTWKGNNKQCDFTANAYMGFANNNQTYGQFYLFTNFKSPYSRSVKEQL